MKTISWFLSIGLVLLLTACGSVPDVDTIGEPELTPALCVVQKEAGHWRNVDLQTRSITRIQLQFVCQDQIHNGQLYPPGPPWYLHLYGKCHPTDCDWGETGARRLSNGHIYGVYNQGFATRYVYARMSQYRPDQLWVYIYTDFSDPNRADYSSQNWFQKTTH